jgi:Zn-dependent membrane protease YugP
MENIVFGVVWFLFAVAVIVRAWTWKKTGGNYYEYLREKNSAGITGGEFAAKALKELRIAGVEIKESPKYKSWRGNGFNALKNTIYLSRRVLVSDTISALCVAANEIGRALQYKDGEKLLTVRQLLMKVFLILWTVWFAAFFFLTATLSRHKTNRRLGRPIYFSALFNMDMAPVLKIFFASGAVIFVVYTLFAVITAPLDFDASNRAFGALKNYISDEEEKSVLDILKSISLYYVASPFPFLK